MSHAISPLPGALLLTGAFGGLGAARSLAARGIPVFVLGPRTSVARFSRSVRGFLARPNRESDDDLIGYLVDIARTQRLAGSVLFPGTDEQVRVVAQNHALLSQHFVLTTPPWVHVRPLCDKRLTLQLAREAGIATPDSHVPGSAAGLAGLNLTFPVVLKPATGSRFLRQTNRKAFRADNGDELRRGFDAMARLAGADNVIVQELLPEPSRHLFSYAGCFRGGEPLAGLAVKRTRQYPCDFGRSSTFVEVVELPELSRLARQLLRPIAYTGLAEIEFMWDARAGQFKLLEVNPRLWAWHSLAIAAGLDLPGVAYCDALGRSVPTGVARIGTKWLRFLTDVRAAAAGIRSGRLGLGEYLSSFRGGTAFSVYARSDPLPAVVEPFLLLVDRLQGAAPRRRT
jgi:predicted ATP-grasp superfamily ATP-dependent carboligase